MYLDLRFIGTMIILYYVCSFIMSILKDRDKRRPDDFELPEHFGYKNVNRSHKKRVPKTK